ncbi:hypothetical protein BOTBODRAFT_181842 [Botryobasidium botryosum FD-172 SS1]|uniref:Uncharacterized protein n=1 Tax=Botryobasidium botryosum (strain FD-172 SS1) TaxID=930990 RepID=A0A067M2Q8_BOTB1|nr:hypothetical protein BOTBODRAFT_181842 [Botryobasidium botryosum FD-172 SS1]
MTCTWYLLLKSDHPVHKYIGPIAKHPTPKLKVTILDLNLETLIKCIAGPVAALLPDEIDPFDNDVIESTALPFIPFNPLADKDDEASYPVCKATNCEVVWCLAQQKFGSCFSGLDYSEMLEWVAQAVDMQHNVTAYNGKASLPNQEVYPDFRTLRATDGQGPLEKK